MGINFVEIENAGNYVPDEFKDRLKGTNWESTVFMTYDIHDTNMAEYDASEETGIFLRNSDNTLDKLDNFTARLALSTGIELEEKDYEVIVHAYFYKGEMKEVTFEEVNFVEREEKEKAQEDFENLMKEIEATTFANPPSLLKRAIFAPLVFVRYISSLLINASWKIQNLLT